MDDYEMGTNKESYSDMSDDRDRDNNEDRDRDRRGNRRGGGSGDRQSNARTNDRDRSPRRDNNSSGNKSKKQNRVFVSNIPYEYRWQDLKDLFREQVGEVSYVELFMDESDKPRGCGIIEFALPDLAKEAVEKMHRYEIKGRKLVVKEEGQDIERDKHGRIVSRESGRSGGGGGSGRGRSDSDRGSSSWNNDMLNGSSSGGVKFGNTYGLSAQFLESLGINGPLITRVFVANLDYKVDERKLREVFKLAGRVMHADLNVDKEGKSRGFGVVEYEHPVEAVQAISMLNNQLLYDRRLSVRMDRVGEKDNRLPDGLKGVGMGLGASGTPLTDVARNLPSMQNQSSNSVSNPSSTSVPPSALSALVDLAANLSNLTNSGGAGALGGSGGLASTLAGSLLAGAASSQPSSDPPLSSYSPFSSTPITGANPLAAQLSFNNSGGSSSFGLSNSTRQLPRQRRN